MEKLVEVKFKTIKDRDYLFNYLFKEEELSPSYPGCYDVKSKKYKTILGCSMGGKIMDFEVKSTSSFLKILTKIKLPFIITIKDL